MPIDTTLNASPKTYSEFPRTNYNAVEWDEVREELEVGELIC